MTLFKITLNWYGERHEVHTHASSVPSAKGNGIIQLAEKLGRTATCVRRYFRDHPLGITIKEVTSD